MPKDKRPTFTIEEAPVRFPNFQGRPGRFNEEGKKGFAIELPPDFAQKLARDGFHVNTIDADAEEGIPGTPIINIKVNFDNRPPRVVMVTSSGPVPLNKKSVGMLDDADIQFADVTCVGHEWERGFSCYLQKGFFVINEDVLDQKYGFGYLSEEGDDD